MWSGKLAPLREREVFLELLLLGSVYQHYIMVMSTWTRIGRGGFSRAAVYIVPTSKGYHGAASENTFMDGGVAAWSCWVRSKVVHDSLSTLRPALALGVYCDYKAREVRARVPR